jgi:hypothetical protein
VATNLDTGASVTFGERGRDHVPISMAIEASAALPGLYPPVRIGGEYYVDGALNKTLHASVALDEGVDLLLCVNPLVPFDASGAGRNGHLTVKKLSQGGLPLVLSQTFRAIIHSRMKVGMESYRRQYPRADVVLFEPDREDADIFFASIFSYAQRKRLCAAAYDKTRQKLATRAVALEKSSRSTASVCVATASPMDARPRRCADRCATAPRGRRATQRGAADHTRPRATLDHGALARDGARAPEAIRRATRDVAARGRALYTPRNPTSAAQLPAMAEKSDPPHPRTDPRDEPRAVQSSRRPACHDRRYCRRAEHQSRQSLLPFQQQRTRSSMSCTRRSARVRPLLAAPVVATQTSTISGFGCTCSSSRCGRFGFSTTTSIC